jgi:hypothetical protein
VSEHLTDLGVRFHAREGLFNVLHLQDGTIEKLSR